jgi:hypothetical protein
MTLIVTQDIYSLGKGKELYAKRNEQVKVIASHENVFIVQGKLGKFSVRIDETNYQK